jgi:nucleoside-diphosphate kinase
VPERTLILIKPDAFDRGLTGEVIRRFERKGLKIAALKLMEIDVDLAERHYSEHKAKPFFPDLVEFITRGSLVAMVLEADGAIEAARQVIGATNPLEAAPGSIRGDFATEITFNLVHGSDSPNSADREVELFFPELAG